MIEPGGHHGNSSARNFSHRAGFNFVLALALVLICFGALALMYYQDRRDHARHLDALVQKSQQLADQILATDLDFLQLLARRAATGNLSGNEYRDRASQYVTYHPYLINITWADADFIIRDTAPFEPNRQVVGLKLSLPEPERASRLARALAAPVYTRPFVVLQGVFSFEVYLPIFRNGEFLGTFGGVYSIDGLQHRLAASLHLNNLVLELRQAGESASGLPADPSEFSDLSRTFPVATVPELQAKLTIPLKIRFPEILILLTLALTLGILLFATSLRLNHELKKRSAMEEELRRNEQFYHSIYDHAGLGITLATFDGVIQSANRAFTDMLGYAPGELNGVSIDTITHPDDLTQSHALLRQAHQHGKGACSLQKRYLDKQEETIWASLTISSLFRPDGSPECLIGMVKNITEQRRAEAALIASEKQYRTLFRAMVQGVFYQLADGRIIAANPSACEMFGLSEDEILGRTSLDPRWKVIHEDGSDYPGPEHPSMVALTTGKVVREAIAGVYNPRSKSIRWLNINAIPEFHPGEEMPFRVFVTLHDITDIKLAEERIKQSEAGYRLLSKQFQTLLDAIPDPMYMLDRDFTLLWRNRACEKFFGTGAEPGKSCTDRFLGRGRICDTCIAQACLMSGDPETGRETIGDGRLLALRAFPVKDDNGEVARVLMLISDETEKLQQQQTMLRTGQLAAVGELAAGVAHEINNPINGIINYAQILSNRLTEESLERQIAQRVMDEAERIATIASSLLSYTRSNAARKRRIPLSEIIAEVMLISGTKLRNQGVSVTPEIPQDLPDLLASPQQLQQVLLNLLSNARYALTARESGRDDHEKSVVIRAVASDNGRVRITVRDTGIGIPQELLSRIQEPFFTTKPGQEGTGLGLSICNDILEQHDSRLEFDSREGEYTAVSFELPCAGPVS